MAPPRPAWLERALSDNQYLRRVIDVLSDREQSRNRAVNYSVRHANPPSHQPSDPFEPAVFYAARAGFESQNTRKNRYIDILPFDRTRVQVAQLGNQAAPRYLNANWVQEHVGGAWWIASQAALPHTAHTFLSVLCTPPIPPPSSGISATPRTIVQLTVNSEHGRVKAHPYFPDNVGESTIVPPDPSSDPQSDPVVAHAIKVTLHERKTIPEAHCIVSTLKLSPVTSPEARAEHLYTIQHCLYTAWPDHGVPKEPSSLIKFARVVDRINREPDGAYPPIIAGCSAGVGRTGAFIALSSLLRAQGVLASVQRSGAISSGSPLGPLPKEFEDDLVAQEVDSLREQRGKMVQTVGQLLLVYEIIGIGA